MDAGQDIEALDNILTTLVTSAEKQINQCNALGQLENIKVYFLGKKSTLSEYFAQLSQYTILKKKLAGQLLNRARAQLESAIEKKKCYLESINFEKLLATEMLDASLPGDPDPVACLHPITTSLNRIKSYFLRLGFSCVQGPEIESRYYNFHALNVPDSHPACSNQDTFWLGPEELLRTHTSGVQIRALQQIEPPFRVLSPGRVYRRDSDQTHTPMFHQVEGLWIQSNLSFPALKALLTDFIHFFFEKSNLEVRFRPSFFPFTVPSAEMDIRIKRKSWTPWMEVLGCGIVHPNLIENANLNPAEWTGLAFGLGVERLAMLRYGIEDLRTLYEHDLSFSKQFLLL